MSRFLVFAALCALVLTSVSCTALAQARPPAFVVSEPIAIRDEISQDGVVRLQTGVWRRTYEVPGANVDEIAETSTPSGSMPAMATSTRRRNGTCGGACVTSRKARYAASLPSPSSITPWSPLPALVDEASLSPGDLERWYRFADAIESHEMAHVEREIAGAESLRQSLLALHAEPDCQAMAARVSEMGERAKESIRRADQAFDAETEHGALEGATFP